MTWAISLDLETLSTHKNAVVVSIGASTVSMHTDAEQTFCVFPNVQEQIDMGRHVSADTLRWWMQQDRVVQLNTFNGEETDVRTALQMLRGWMIGHGTPPVWTKGPAFDGAIIDSLAEDVGLPSPIMYRKHRDVRTIEDAVENSGDPELHMRLLDAQHKAREGRLAHDAVTDSIMQGDIVRWWFQELRACRWRQGSGA